MAQAEEALKRLTDFLARLEALPAGAGNERRRLRRVSTRPQRAFAEHIAADLNTAAAMGVMFDLVRRSTPPIDAGEAAAADAAAIRGTFARFDRVLGVLSLRRAEDETAAGAGRRDRTAHPGTPRRPTGAELRRSGPHPQGSGQPRHPAGGHWPVNEMEEKVTVTGPRSRRRCLAPRPRPSSKKTRSSSPRRTRATIRSSSRAGRGPSSKTWTATASSIAPPALR